MLGLLEEDGGLFERVVMCVCVLQVHGMGSLYLVFLLLLVRIYNNISVHEYTVDKPWMSLDVAPFGELKHLQQRTSQRTLDVLWGFFSVIVACPSL